MIDDEIREVAERIVNKLFEDVVEVVRCKDCKYWEKEYDEYDGEEWWTCGKYEPYNSNDVMHADDFCSRGEKR